MMERAKQWFAFLGGVVAWLIHLLVTYSIGEGACVGPGSLFELLGLSAAAWSLIAISLFALAMAGYATRMARIYCRSAEEGARFLGRAGFLANTISIVVIVAQTLPIPFLLGGC